MSRKYKTDEERYQALREYRHNYYLRVKDTEKFKKYMKEQHKKYYEENKEEYNKKRTINMRKAKERKLNKIGEIKCK